MLDSIIIIHPSGIVPLILNLASPLDDNIPIFVNDLIECILLNRPSPQSIKSNIVEWSITSDGIIIACSYGLILKVRIVKGSKGSCVDKAA